MNLPYLLTPFLETRNICEQNYNRSHIRTRVKVEHLIGIWKRRFPIMAYGCRMKIENVLPVIVATAVLHNIATTRGEPLPPADEEIEQAILNGHVPYEIQRFHVDRMDFRRVLAETYFN